jgi:hypothetical protein
MFVGHYAAALAAKAYEPKAPLWTYVGACQLLDIGWSGLVMAGVEKLRIDPSLGGGSDLDLYFMPYTHSLPAALLWSLGAAILARLFRLGRRAAVMIGLVVFSHWLLDLLVHRPDLEIGFGVPKQGLGLWTYALPEMVLEMGMLALAGAAWVAERKTTGLKAWPAVLFIAVLTGVQMASSSMSGGSGDPKSFGLTALIAYLVVTGIAWLVERGASRGSAAAA